MGDLGDHDGQASCWHMLWSDGILRVPGVRLLLAAPETTTSAGTAGVLLLVRGLRCRREGGERRNAHSAPTPHDRVTFGTVDRECFHPCHRFDFAFPKQYAQKS